MARIRHIAIITEKPVELAEFWRDVFGFEITGIADCGDAWVTDGYMNIALLLRRREEMAPGINHWGVTVDEEEKEEIYVRLKERGLEPAAAKPMVIDGVVIDRPFVEDKAHDLDGNTFDISTGMRELTNASTEG